MRRIYRTRNLAVNEGIIPHRAETLIENAHIYLDTFLNETFELSFNEKIRTLEQGVKEGEIKNKVSNDFLLNEDIQKCSPNTSINYLFGSTKIE